MSKSKVYLIRLVTFLAGLYFVLKFILPKDNSLIDFSVYHENIINGFTALSAMAVGLGLINLFLSHGLKVVYKKSGWIFSFVLLSGLLLMIFVQTSAWLSSMKDSDKAASFVNLSDFSRIIVADEKAQKKSVKSRTEREVLLYQAFNKDFHSLQEEIKNQSDFKALEQEIQQLYSDSRLDDSEHSIFQNKVFALSTLLRVTLDKRRSESLTSRLNSILNDGLFVALGSAMFALLGFYIAAAAYRAFRIKSVEAALMMSAAIIVMLGQIPFGLWLYEDLPAVRLWLLQVPSAGAARAIEIGAGIAGLILAVRMWLSLDSESFK